MVLLVSFAFSQNSPVTMTGTGTLTNADTVELSQTVKGVYETVSFQPVITRLSGTASGNVTLLGSLDGTNFVSVTTTSLSIANQVTNSTVLTVDGSNYYYYKLRAISTSTVVSARASGICYPYKQSGGNHAVNLMKSDINATSDTVTNAGTGYVQLQVKGSYKNVVIQAVSDKISGTAGGTITLQGSNDGINFVTVNTSYIQNPNSLAPYTTGGAATLTVTNVATSTAIFVVNGSPYAYYRLSHTGTGTMSSRLRGYLMPNP